MADSKHTPGPWEAQIIVPGRDALILSFDSIAGMHNSGDYTAEEFEANARLIAAAPETAAERDRLKEINAELLWVVEHEARYHTINAQRDAGFSVASHDKEFVAKFPKRKQVALAKARGQS